MGHGPVVITGRTIVVCLCFRVTGKISQTGSLDESLDFGHENSGRADPFQL